MTAATRCGILAIRGIMNVKEPTPLGAIKHTLMIRGLLAIARHERLSARIRNAAMRLRWLGVPLRHATIYVGMGGNDTNDGLTWSTRLETTSTAISAAWPGDCIILGAGTNREYVTI